MRTALPALAPGPSPRASRWYVAAVALTLFDAAASGYHVRSPADELNPILSALMAQAGIAPVLTARAVYGVALLTILLALAPRSAVARRGLWVSASVLAAVAVWHGIGFAVALLAST